MMRQHSMERTQQMRIILFFVLILNVVGCWFIIEETPCPSCKNIRFKGYLHAESYDEGISITPVKKLKNFAGLYLTVSRFYPLFPSEDSVSVIGKPASLGCGCEVAGMAAYFSKEITYTGVRVSPTENILSDNNRWRLFDSTAYPFVYRFKDSVAVERGQIDLQLKILDASGATHFDTLRLQME